MSVTPKSPHKHEFEDDTRFGLSRLYWRVMLVALVAYITGMLVRDFSGWADVGVITVGATIVSYLALKMEEEYRL